MTQSKEYYDALHRPGSGPEILQALQQQFKEPCPDEAILDEHEKALIERIREAFKDVRLENGIGLMQAEAEDDYASMDIQNYLAQYEERENWDHLTASQLNACSSALSYVDAKGFRFLIPAFVIHDIKNQLLAANPYYSLTYNYPRYFDFDGKSWLEKKCALLSENQKTVLQEYIRYYREKNDEYYYSLWDTPEDKKSW